MKLFSLEGKTALITGASGGIGAEVARVLHEQGAFVILSGTRAERLDPLKKELGANACVVTANLSDSAEADGLIAKAEEAAGRPIDILVNNAGLTRDMLALRMKDEDWEQVIKVDLESPFRICRAALKGMLKRRAGRIINMSSIVGETGNAGQANYASAKAGLIGMSKSLAQETASRGVTVNVVAPGFIDTAMTEGLPDTVKEKLLTAIPLGKMGTPKDIAAAVAYLASDEAGWVTGSTLHVNGGMGMF